MGTMADFDFDTDPNYHLHYLQQLVGKAIDKKDIFKEEHKDDIYFLGNQLLKLARMINANGFKEAVDVFNKKDSKLCRGDKIN